MIELLSKVQQDTYEDPPPGIGHSIYPKEKKTCQEWLEYITGLILQGRERQRMEQATN